MKRKPEIYDMKPIAGLFENSINQLKALLKYCPECLIDAQNENDEDNAPELIEELSEDAKMVFSGTHLMPEEFEHTVIKRCPICGYEIETNQKIIQ